ncbi:LysR substrate-binding domain-containing protein [Psychromarinibacter sp. S121]|uniref:LysR substrate-binding domain-containing protein n=1 Tax=Psychromarinibacter sp. S121 TaxID=3415127 RepID=UPI003C79C475
MRRLPPFAAIRAFEATARHGSMKAAAEELCVTASAVSHQIRTLEEFLDTALFLRDGNRLILTLTGKTYVGKLTGLLDALDESTRDLRGGRDLRVLTTPGFAARFMVPRLSGFRHGDLVRLRVSEGAPDTDFARNDADVVIHWGDTPVPGVVVEPLMESARYPVISPGLRDRERIETPEDLLRVTLFHDEVMDAWPAWFAAAGIEIDDRPRGPRYPHCELSSTAAERGQGVALAYDAMVRGTLRAGVLVRLFEQVMMPVTIYSVAYLQDRETDPLIREFRDWIFAEAALEGLVPPRGGTVAAE